MLSLARLSITDEDLWDGVRVRVRVCVFVFVCGGFVRGGVGVGSA